MYSDPIQEKQECQGNGGDGEQIRSFLSNPGLRGKREIRELCGDIVHAVASIPDSLKIWFYGEKRHEEGKAFGCWVRVGDFASRMELLCEAEVTATTANMESSRDVENPLVKQVEKKGSSSRSCM